MLRVILNYQLMDAALARGLQYLADATGDVVATGRFPEFAQRSVCFSASRLQDRLPPVFL
jgi:hypothetical protein